MTHATRSCRIRNAGAAIALTGAAGLASACGGDDAKAASVVSILDAGEGATTVLPVPYEVGQSASTSATFAAAIDINGAGADESVSFAFQLDLTSTVSEVDDGGGSVVISTIEDAEWLEQPEGVDDGLITDMVGLTYSESYDAAGLAGSRELVNDEELSDDQRQAAEDMLEQSESVAFEFPVEPVAVGATWTSDTTISSNGLEFPATYHYELVSLDDESFVIDVTYDSPVDTDVDGMNVTGRISGSGSITGAVDNPLELAYQIEQDANISAEDDGDSIDMQMTITFDNAVIGAADGSVDSTDHSATGTTAPN